MHYLIKPFTFAAFAEKLERYATVRRQLQGPGRADQAEVDRLFATLRGSSSGPALPKGLSRSTCDLVERVLRQAGDDRSAAEVAELAGMSRVSARRYLEHLTRDGRRALAAVRRGRASRTPLPLGGRRTIVTRRLWLRLPTRAGICAARGTVRDSLMC